MKMERNAEYTSTLITHKQINDQTLDLSRNAIIHIFIPRLFHERVQKQNKTKHTKEKRKKENPNTLSEAEEN